MTYSIRTQFAALLSSLGRSQSFVLGLDVSWSGAALDRNGWWVWPDYALRKPVQLKAPAQHAIKRAGGQPALEEG